MGNGVVAVITGAGGDIGRALIETIIEGSPESRCAAVDLEPDHSRDLAERFGDERVLQVVSDATDPASVESALDAVLNWAGPIQQLVNSIGTTHGAPSLDFPPDQWERVLKVHLSGTFYWCQTVGRHMKDHGGGAIVNLSSVAAYSGWPGRIPYGVAKAGINSLTQTLAVEWAEYGIRVNAVAPGYIDTRLARYAISQGWLDETKARSLHAMDRFGEVNEVTSVIEFLLSDAASFITGEIVRVDGGFVARKID